MIVPSSAVTLNMRPGVQHCFPLETMPVFKVHVEFSTYTTPQQSVEHLWNWGPPSTHWEMQGGVEKTLRLAAVRWFFSLATRSPDTRPNSSANVTRPFPTCLGDPIRSRTRGLDSCKERPEMTNATNRKRYRSLSNIQRQNDPQNDPHNDPKHRKCLRTMRFITHSPRAALVGGGRPSSSFAVPWA